MKLIVCGAGSVGINSLKVAKELKLQIFAVSVHTDIKTAIYVCNEFKPEFLIVTSNCDISSLILAINTKKLTTKILQGMDTLVDLMKQADTIIMSITGSASLHPTYEAAKMGKKILIASKEALVMAGNLITQETATIIPLDSEHNAIMQCLQDKNNIAFVRQIILTGSGGSLRDFTKQAIENATVKDVLKHPNWTMGDKITVDSATLVNKGLEFIEAMVLFGINHEQIKVLIHRQSIVHSLVEYIDGSLIAHLSNPDMRIPIAYALTLPNRTKIDVQYLDLLKNNCLTFEEPKYDLFPCLQLAFDVAKTGESLNVAFSVANEVAVSMFLKNQIKFTDIYKVIYKAIENQQYFKINSIEQVLDLERTIREQLNR